MHSHLCRKLGKWLEAAAQKAAGLVGLVLLSKRNYSELKDKETAARKYRIMTLARDNVRLGQFEENWRLSKSQLGQDVLALVVADFKREGYFVEFGATNGVTLSNTYLLEKQHNWQGILAEPGQQWFPDLETNRNAKIISKAVYSVSDLTLDFIEAGELSTISKFKSSDHHARSGRTYKVNTVALADVLREAKAPRFIDYMSIDTEGSEFEILENFVFEDYEFGLITIEHNFTEAQGKLDSLLSSKGYRRILQEVSEWDAWYIRA